MGAGLPAARRAPAWGGTPPPACPAAPRQPTCPVPGSTGPCPGLQPCPRAWPPTPPTCVLPVTRLRSAAGRRETSAPASAGLGPFRHPEPGGGTGRDLGALIPVPCSPLGAPCPGTAAGHWGMLCPLAHSRAACPAPRRELSLEFWCGWSWESQPCSPRSSAGAGVWGASPALPGALLELQFGVPARLSPEERLGLGGSGQGPGTGAFLRGPQVRGQRRFRSPGPAPRSLLGLLPLRAAAARPSVHPSVRQSGAGGRVPPRCKSRR